MWEKYWLIFLGVANQSGLFTLKLKEIAFYIYESSPCTLRTVFVCRITSVNRGMGVQQNKNTGLISAACSYKSAVIGTVSYLYKVTERTVTLTPWPYICKRRTWKVATNNRAATPIYATKKIVWQSENSGWQRKCKPNGSLQRASLLTRTEGGSKEVSLAASDTSHSHQHAESTVSCVSTKDRYNSVSVMSASILDTTKIAVPQHLGRLGSHLFLFSESC
jgi:hypothetical protein